MKTYRDRDFLRSKEGFLFCVVGPYHPSDRVISYLKYLPDPSGLWKRGSARFKRAMRTYTIPNLLETFRFLKNTSPQYLFFSTPDNIIMTAVPRDYIAEHFEPRRKLAQLFKRTHLDRLQNRTVRLVSLLCDLSKIETCSFGVTGSVLLGIHNPIFSDMDITIYGTENSYSLKAALEGAFTTANSGVRRLGKELATKWCSSKTHSHPLTLCEAKRIFDRKWGVGLFEGTRFSIHSVRLEDELAEKYGDKIYSPVRIVTLKVRISDSKDSIFLPSVYRVVGAQGVLQAVEEIVSYEGLYSSMGKDGEVIEVRGKLEHVVDTRTGREYDRVLVGSLEGRGREYIKPIG